MWVAYQPGTRQRFWRACSFEDASGPAVITSWKVYFRATGSSWARWCCRQGGGSARHGEGTKREASVAEHDEEAEDPRLKPGARVQVLPLFPIVT